MRRFLYRALIALHPPRFRERFGDEMMCVFDEAGHERAARFFADGILSLLRQWLLRSNLWKMAAGTAISALLLCAWGNSMVRGVDMSLMRVSLWHERVMMNASFDESPRPFDEAEFSREAAQAVEILAEIRKTKTRKHHSQSHEWLHSTPNLSSSDHASKG